MATSRRRERELARRRFERRRQAELERRARAKKRNTMLGAVIGTVVLLAGVVAGGIAIFHHSPKSKPKASNVTPGSTPNPTADPTASPAVTPTSTIPPAPPKKCTKILPDPPVKGEPTIPQVTGKPSTKLVTKDIKVGHGAVAKAGQTITVKYVGIACSTGIPFDASYTDGAKNKEFSFQLGAGKVIQGWDKGIVGMKVGGVRELIIPSSLGYGTAGSGTTIKPDETLIFVVTLDKV